MPLPAALLTRTVTGTVLALIAGPDALSAKGRVLFAMPADTPLYDVTDAAVLAPQVFAADVDTADGTFSIELPCNDSTGITPADWLYDVTIFGRNLTTGGTIAVPDGVGDLDFTAAFMPGTDPAPTPALYATQAYVQAQVITAVSDLTAADVDLGNVINSAQLVRASNLSDLPAPVTARANLGLGTAAVAAIGVGAADVAGGLAPFWSGASPSKPGRYLYTGTGASSTVTPTQSQTRYIPVFAWQALTIVSISIEVTTGQVSGVVRIGRWTDSGFLPDVLVADYGTVPATGASVQTVTPAQPIVVPAGTGIWLSATCQGAAGIVLRGSSNHDPLILPSSTGVTNAGINAYVQSGVTGALAGPAVPADASGGPRFMLLLG